MYRYTTIESEATLVMGADTSAHTIIIHFGTTRLLSKVGPTHPPSHYSSSLLAPDFRRNVTSV